MALRAALLAALLLAPAAARAALEPAACPAGLPAGTECFRGRDAQGAFVTAARPPGAHGGLVVHSHGGPRLDAPTAATADEDLLRFREFLSEGWSWVQSSRRRGGFGVAMGGEDTEAARRLYVARFGPPALTVAHGQSYGALVTALLLERHNEPGPDGRRPYDAALLTSGVLAGATRAYDMRMDLRAAFQAICGTHPGPEEEPYHLALGLPEEARMTPADLRARLEGCTGGAAPTPAQAAAARALSAASRVPERALAGHLNWATFGFRDVARHVTQGRPAFGNDGVRYADPALDARIPRFAADPEARAALAADADPTGRTGALPTLVLHGAGDATAFVEHAAAYAATRAAAGTGGSLAALFADEVEHSKMSAPLYPAALALLAEWARGGPRPGHAALAARCAAMQSRHPGECRLMPEGWAPQPWEARVNAPR
ncbi:hypothetical protein ACI6QG_08065 [Roseococcus sp. DSY-14]|uniref:hypothetical protein n=1 Tax=Roseococcus sp. DSY-14 TaxID=3369650 RepID=UPI00387B6B6C